MPALAPEQLLRHQDFVRALARQLLRDDATADDVAQSAMVAALEHPPRDGGATRTWLGRVTERLAFRLHRGETRRAQREELVATRREGAPSPAEIEEREQTRRRVVAAVMSLEEPYRSAILLRFYDGLEASGVATQLGVPVETARTRVKRGLAQLRARLESDFGGGAWSLALAPLALRVGEGGGGTTGAASTGVRAATQLTIAATALVATGGAIWLATRTPEPTTLAATALHDGSPRSERDGDPLLASVADGNAARRVETPTAAVNSTTAPAAPAASTESTSTNENTPSPLAKLHRGTIRGRVVDAEGLPVAHARVTADRMDGGRGRDGSTTTNERGEFVMHGLLVREHRITVTDPRGGTSIPWSWRNGVVPSDEEVVLRVDDAKRATASAHGIVEGADDDGWEATSVSVWRSDPPSSAGGELDTATGHFRVGPLPPGAYVLRVCSDRARNAAPIFIPLPSDRYGGGETSVSWRTALVPFTLKAKEDLDLGSIHMELPGTVILHTQTDDGENVDATWLIEELLGVNAGDSVPTFTPPRARTALAHAGRPSGSHALGGWRAGHYRATVLGRGFLTRHVEFDIESKRWHDEVVVLQRSGAVRALRILPGEFTRDLLANLRCTLRTTAGAPVFDGRPRQLGQLDSDGPLFEIALSLAPGEYQLSATTDAGPRGKVTFVVPIENSAEDVVDLTLGND